MANCGNILTIYGISGNEIADVTQLLNKYHFAFVLIETSFYFVSTVPRESEDFEAELSQTNVHYLLYFIRYSNNNWLGQNGMPKAEVDKINELFFQ